MAKLLNDIELKKLIQHNIIIGGNEDCVRPNAYVLRLGAKGEYINIENNKEFNINNKKKGFKLPPGVSVAIISLEELDFRRDTVHQLYPKCDLFAWMSPITDLSREGIITQTTQIDVGFNGVLNWTFNNTSNKENEFLYKENLYRLSIFKLEDGEEVPERPYEGTYQNQKEIVRSKRKGAPRGMKESEWETPFDMNSPEKHLEFLASSGYPWNILSKQFKALDGEFKTITDEYSRIDNSITKLNHKVDSIPNEIDKKINAKQSDFLINIAVVFSALIGVVISVVTNDITREFLFQYGAFVGLGILIVAISIFVINKKKG
jgi:deoxycytidine triphosphate deaminase/tetrahydromethanopterin S-methyltransferase subunit G